MGKMPTLGLKEDLLWKSQGQCRDIQNPVQAVGGLLPFLVLVPRGLGVLSKLTVASVDLLVPRMRDGRSRSDPSATRPLGCSGDLVSTWTI